ncbi:hypothetical protein N7489_008731 [Penicillium chrysogenum]|uniref:AMP-dependent synthetase/ligase domain-containing protein n=1 Tax=Penicillium chrysogenum TaxID=5076 RepID=A0ABQ8X066_PENCH|nr:uncharacterized protein N7489_008731 [Penicillium chrysogenum]KAJ5228023.1 hypothetical protein N7489_008731 [Penicillium chrysogenum]KAJ5284346.1 hypothetical protein N7505_002326 [Penicillium chrysogenum]KAJ5286252.1 hypothetical protein N7524_001558 [Penicillium chrysogenum]
MWVTLISGATIVVMPRMTATDPGAFGSFLKSHNVTVTFVTAALFQIIAFADPSAFSSLRHVFNGGDAANEHQNPIRDSGIRGEIYIGGPQQSLGYLNWPNKTSQSFVHLERRMLGLQGEGTVRLYRTYDCIWIALTWRILLRCVDLSARRGARGFLTTAEEVLGRRLGIQSLQPMYSHVILHSI